MAKLTQNDVKRRRLELTLWNPSLSGICSLRSQFPIARRGVLAKRKARADAEESLTLRDFVATRRHPSPPAAGLCKTQIKKAIK